MRDYGVGIVLGMILAATLAPILVVLVQAAFDSLEVGLFASRAGQLLYLAQAVARFWTHGA